jgi:para-nitrobenzyl esterase
MSKAISQSGLIFDRRQALWLSATAGVGLALGRPARASDSIKTGAHQQEPATCSTPRSAVAKTQYGPVRGYVDGGVFTFKGIPYGANTGGENRFLPPKPPERWKDEYPALVYGGNCPQHLHDWTGIEQTFLQDWDDGWQSEDMLKLNIWTPSLSGSRAVMFYIHGGGFEFGSSYELPSHEGAQMARHHDVVQVSVNHRLNALGFLDVSELGGSAYEDSRNLSFVDLVFALQWVQENIANFGGDPNKVMIYGQSGGGSKVTTLLGMPAAKGLIHRASAQSGGGGQIPTAEQQKEFSTRVIKELGVSDITALQKMDWSRMYAAGRTVAAKMNPPRRDLVFGPPSGPGSMPQVGWTPCIDGRNVICKSFEDVAPDTAKDVPVLFGNVSEETMRYISNPTEEEWHANLAKVIGDQKASTLITAMKKAHPEKSIKTLSYGVGGLSARNKVDRMAKLKHVQGGAKAYQWYFCWQSPMLNRDAGAWHTAELAFCFDNTRRCEQGTGNTPEAQAIAKKMATAWSNFARTGDPSQPGLAWPAADPEHGQTMVFDKECRMVNDPEGEVRKLIES